MSDRRVIGYYIAGGTAEDLAEKTIELLRQGFELYGNVVAAPNGGFYREMVKYAPEEVKSL